MPDGEVEKKITRREFIKKGTQVLAGLAATGAIGLGSADLLSKKAQEDKVKDINKYGKPEFDPGPMARTIFSPKYQAVYGYMTMDEENSSIKFIGGGEIFISKDGEKWFNTNLSLRTKDPDGDPASISIMNAVIGPKSRDVYFLMSNAVPLNYKDVDSGAGFIRDPNKLEVLRAKGADLRVVADFEGGEPEFQKANFINIINSFENSKLETA